MVNSALDLLKSLGRKSTLAFHLRKRPSTLAPICLETNRISLLSMSTPCAPALDEASSIMAREGMNGRKSLMDEGFREIGGSAPGEHPGQQLITVDPLVLQRRRDMECDHGR